MRRLGTGLVVLLFVALFAGAASAAALVLSDFETDIDLAQWEATGAIVDCPAGTCVLAPAGLSRVTDHATNGSYSCRLDLPVADFPGMNMVSFAATDWSAHDVLQMDFYNPNALALVLHIELSDSVQGSAWPKRFYCEKALIPGTNNIEIDLHNLERNDSTGNVDTANIDRFLFYVTGHTTEVSVYCDYVRLDTVQDDPTQDAVRGIFKFDFGTGSSPRWRDFFGVTSADTYSAAQGWGWTDGGPRWSGDFGGPDDLARDWVRGIPCCPTAASIDFRVDLPNGDYTVYAVARSGESHAMPVLPWEIWAEGVREVNVAMDSSIFFTENYYYRGLNDDYPLTESYWSRYVDPHFPAYTFTTTVSDGNLVLNFNHCWVYMLIVYPTSLAGEMVPRVSDWEADRQTQFESAFYVNPPESLTFSPTAAESTRGYAAWPVAVIDPTYPDTLPPSPRPSLTLSTAGSQGEYQAVTLAIRPSGDLTGVSVDGSNLTDGGGNSIPSSEIDCQYVRYLATPDTEFFGSGVLTWKPRLIQDTFPISVKSEVTKEFWITIHIPDGTPAGTYTGSVNIHASSGELSVPLTVGVYPFTLDSADDMAYGWYYMAPEDRYCLNTRWFPDLAGAADGRLRSDFADMRRHGFNSIEFPRPSLSGIDFPTGHVSTVDMSRLDRYVDAMQAVGFGGNRPGQVGTVGLANSILSGSAVTEFDSNFDAAFKDVLARVAAWGEADGVPLVMYLVDEPRESMIQPWNRNLADTLEYCALANQVPDVVSTVTVMQDTQESVDYTPLAGAIDIMQTHPWPNSSGLAASAASQDKPIWWYNTGGDLRLVYGFYQYKIGDGCWNWHFDWLDSDIWNPHPYSPFNNHWRYTYPSPDGPVPTLNYEWASLGITDYRYVATLGRMSSQARASGDPDLVAWADQADALLQSLVGATPDFPTGVSEYFAGISPGPSYLPDLQAALESYRRQIATMIVSLPEPIPGSECQVVSTILPAGLDWDATANAFVTVRNISAQTWQASDTYQLEVRSDSDHWGTPSAALDEDVLPGYQYRFEFVLQAPPCTTLQYPAGITGDDRGTTDSVPCNWRLTRGGAPVSGGSVTHEIVVSRFPDIQPGTDGEWARFYIEQCAGRIPLVVQGYPNGDYGPSNTVTRDAMAAFTRRAMGIDQISWQGTFPDVSASHWAVGDIEALAEAGVVGGYPDGRYHPSWAVTRAQMAVFVTRARSYESPTVTADVFPDVRVGHWADAQIQACVDHGVVNGYPDGFYRPSQVVSRAEMAVFVYRAFIQPTGEVVVLAGPTVTSYAIGSQVVYPTGTSTPGWPAAQTLPQADPGWAYVALDARRMDGNLAGSGAFVVAFALRESGGAIVDGSAVSLTSAEIIAARDTAVTNGGPPYLVVAWELPGGLPTGSYDLEVDVTRDGSPAQELASVTIEISA